MKDYDFFFFVPLFWNEILFFYSGQSFFFFCYRQSVGVGNGGTAPCLLGSKNLLRLNWKGPRRYEGHWLGNSEAPPPLVCTAPDWLTTIKETPAQEEGRRQRLDLCSTAWRICEHLHVVWSSFFLRHRHTRASWESKQFGDNHGTDSSSSVRRSFRAVSYKHDEVSEGLLFCFFKCT